MNDILKTMWFRHPKKKIYFGFIKTINKGKINYYLDFSKETIKNFSNDNNIKKEAEIISKKGIKLNAEIVRKFFDEVPNENSLKSMEI